MSRRSVRTVFLGSGAFAVPVLERLVSLPSIDLAGVVTAPSRPAGRGQQERPSPVGAWAETTGLPVLTPHRLRSPESVAAVRGLRPDLLVLADYGQIVPPELLELPRHGPLNLHPSLLPRHRGATPIPAVILAGDDETGVSLMRMDADLDMGPVIAQVRTRVLEAETAPELEARLASMAADLLAASIDAWIAGILTAVPQSAGAATTTRPLRREDGRLSPSSRVVDLERQVRAYQPWPGSYLDTPAGRLIVWRATAQPSADAATAAAADRDSAANGSAVPDEPGPLISTEARGLALRARDGLLVLDEVQPAGGRRMTGAELVRGRPSIVLPPR